MRLAIAFGLAAFLLTACGGSATDDLPAGPARTGAELFEMKVLGENPGCITCHSLDADTTIIGPSIAGIATRAATRIPGIAAEDYIRQSITNSADYIVAGFTDQMPDDWTEVLTASEIDALVSYLLTLEE